MLTLAVTVRPGGRGWVEWPLLLLDFSACHGLSMTNNMFRHRGVYMYTSHRDTLGSLWRFAEAKTWVRKEFGEVIENDFQTALKRFWTTIQRLRKEQQSTINTVYSWDGVLLTSTKDVVDQWRKYFETSSILPTHLPVRKQGPRLWEWALLFPGLKLLKRDHTPQPPWEGLIKGTGEEHSPDSQTLDSEMSNVVFILDVEQWTSSTGLWGIGLFIILMDRMWVLGGPGW